MSKKTGISVTIALLVVTAAFCGCGKSQPPATSTAAQQPASSPAAPPASAPAASPAPAASSAPPASSAASSSTPAPVDGDLPEVKIALNELKRTSSNTVTLRLTVYNTSDKEFSPQGVFDGDEYHRFRHVGAIHLIDAESKKKYFVVTDSDGTFLCSNNILNIAPKSQIILWAKFPAPPNEVRKITVEIPHFVPFEDVPIVQ